MTPYLYTYTAYSGGSTETVGEIFYLDTDLAEIQTLVSNAIAIGTPQACVQLLYDLTYGQVGFDVKLRTYNKFGTYTAIKAAVTASTYQRNALLINIDSRVAAASPTFSSQLLVDSNGSLHNTPIGSPGTYTGVFIVDSLSSPTLMYSLQVNAKVGTDSNDYYVYYTSNSKNYIIESPSIVQIPTGGDNYRLVNNILIYGSQVSSSTDIATCTATLDKYNWTYTGSYITPSVTVVDDNLGYTLVEGVDYSVSYANNLTPGTASVIVTGIGNYTGQRAVPFVIWEAEDPYGQGGESDTEGGDGDYDDSSDDIDFSSLPTYGALASQFVTLYTPTATQLANLASYLWTGLFDPTNLKKIFADPMDAILGLHVVPVPISYTPVNMYIVDVNTGVTLNRAMTQYITVDCGSVNVTEFWGAYLDYAPMTKAEIFLPYIGFRALNVDDIMDTTLTLKYHVDIVSGACVAQLKITSNHSKLNSVTYSFYGNCSTEIPITGTNWDNMIRGAVSVATSAGALIASGGASAPLSIPALANTAINGLKPEVQKSGMSGGTTGLMDNQTPYLVLTRPNQIVPGNQNLYEGYPAFLTRTLSEISGYTEIEDINLVNCTATQDEYEEIIRLLKAGVLL